MSEENAGLATGEPAGLDAILDSAIETHTEPAAPDKAAEADQPDLKQDATGRLHGKGGKFAPKTSSAAEAPDKGTAEAAKPAANQPPPDPAQAQPVEAPARWTAEDKAKFATWPPDVQKAVVERNKAIEADYTRKTQEAADIRKSAEPLLNAIKPFEAYLTQLGPVTGRNPPEMIAGLLQTEHTLRTGTPEQKYQAWANIGRDYGLDPRAFTTGQIPQPDPVISQLRQQVSELSQWRTQYEQHTEAQSKQQLDSTIDAFATAKDEAGRSKYPHFERVKGVMAHALQNGEAATLEEAYQKAMEPINTAIAEELKTRTQTAEQQREQSVAKATKALPVKTSGNAPGATKATGLDAILDERLSAAGF